jgi:hypothetical protein
MEINNRETLLKLLRSTGEEEASQLLKRYTEIIKRDTIDYTWDRARVLVRHISKNRRQRVKKSMVNYDVESGMISLLQFTKFVAALEDAAMEHYKNGTEEVKSSIGDIINQLYQSLGNVRIDRRILFSKDG